MGTRKLWPLCRKTLIFERKKGIKTLKRFFFRKVKKVYLRNDEVLIVCKFHPNRTKTVASMQENPYFLKKGIKTLKRLFIKKMKKVYLRNDEMLIMYKFHPNRTKIVASMQENPYF